MKKIHFWWILDDEATTENKSDDEGTKDATKEGADPENNKDRTFYKKDDFFDNISCEALERSKGYVRKKFLFTPQSPQDELLTFDLFLYNSPQKRATGGLEGRAQAERRNFWPF